MPIQNSVTVAAGRVDVPLDALFNGGGLHCVYQPFVDLDTGYSVLAHEALLRGPANTPWESPVVLLQAAGDAGRLVDLEACSLRDSLRQAENQSRGRALTLFVNIEPSTLTQRLDVVLELLAGRAEQVQVVVEITQRALAADLAGVLSGAEKLRAAGCAIVGRRRRTYDRDLVTAAAHSLVGRLTPDLL